MFFGQMKICNKQEIMPISNFQKVENLLGTFDGVEGESLLAALDDLAVASGSACATLSAEPSYVLRALGHSDRLAQSTLRLSLGRWTTTDEVDHAARRIAEEVGHLRAISPLAAREPG